MQNVLGKKCPVIQGDFMMPFFTVPANEQKVEILRNKYKN